MFTASQLLDKINNHLSEIQITRTPEGLYEPIEYILSLGGKRIRPVLMLMAYNLYKEDVSSIYDPATGIEVYHNHTLLHDDLIVRICAEENRLCIRSGTITQLFCRVIPC
jgi:geranylgeranyl diphosphate synthase type II